MKERDKIGSGSRFSTGTIVAIIAIVSFVCLFFRTGSPCDRLGDHVDSVLASLFAAGVFWLFCVWLQERREYKAQKTLLKNRYRFTKEGVLSTFLMALGHFDTKSDGFERLKEPKQFRSFANEIRAQDQSNWDAVMSEWETTSSLLSDTRFYFIELVNSLEQSLPMIRSRNGALYHRLSSYCAFVRSVFSLSILQAEPAKHIGWKLVYPMLAAWKNECERDDSPEPVFWVERAINEL